MPLVSVVIPSYNAARYVGAAIESVLAQTAADLEVVVVDDGSSDDTERIVRGYGPKVRYLRQQNAGVAAARNHGLAESRGRLVGFLDADDTWLPRKLERQTAALAARPELRACYSAFTAVDHDLRPLGVRRSPRVASMLEDLLLRGNVVGSICTVLCEKALFDAAGGFDRALSQCADWDMWIRLSLLTDFLYLDEPLVTYRQHATNMSRDIRLYEKDSMLLLDKAFALPGLPPEVRARRSEAYGRMFLVLAGSYYHAGAYADFLRCSSRALAHDPRRLGHMLGYPWRRLRRGVDSLWP
jgi:glycosyltransferase involved in cell wall biosynthesis